MSGGRAARLRALLGKELLDVARNRGALVPVAIVTVVSIAIPFAIAVLVPAVTGRPLSDDADLVKVSVAAGARAGLSSEAQIQVFLFEQFLMLFLLTPITGAMALAAHAIVGEKQARTLEPLLATPITTRELLVAKMFGALIPALAISSAGLAIYVAGVAGLAEPGVLPALLDARDAALILLLGPAAALVALQTAILISSRVNDARTAQQFGVLIILPLTAVLVAEVSGSLWLSAKILAAAGLGLVVLWAALTWISVALFEREAILTRWR